MNERPIVALYARVSSDQQAKSGTIESQITALRERIAGDGEQVADELCFIDAGVSGATLIRPQLERLRDRASTGLLERVYILSPDRLSRKYAHQALLMEEFGSCGVEVVFLNHAIGSTPEEELLLQMQGMIAEYERAKIMERNRRGKLHVAKRGSVNVLGGAPYGYRYRRKQLDGTPAQYVIELAQAATVRKIFHWVGVERLSIGEVTRRLAQEETATATGKPHWDRSVIWGMLQNPASMGRAAFGKTQARDPLPHVRPARHSAETPKKGHSTVRTEQSEWIDIAVPALIDEALFVAVQEQLEENRKLARQRRGGASYLLQGLIVCGHCHYAYYGKKVGKSAAKGGQQYVYYRCIGTDAYRFGGERICDNKQVRTRQLDDLVWQQVIALLQHPERLRQEYETRLHRLEQDHHASADTATLEKHKRHFQQGKSRLIDSYTEGLIDKADFDPKMTQLKVKLEQLQAQIDASKRQHAGQAELFLVINRLEQFAAAVNDRLSSLDFNTKREIIRALVKRIEIHREEIVVVFRVDPDPDIGTDENESDDSPGTSSMQDRKRRSLARAQQYLPALRARPLVRETFRQGLCRQRLPDSLRRRLCATKAHAGRQPGMQLCCTSDEGRPLEAAVQAEASNYPLRLRSRGVVVSELGNGRAGPGQVRIVESNASEPPMTCRKRRNDVKTEGESLTRDQSGRHLFTARMASGIKAARTRSRRLCGTWEPVTPMLREPRKGKPPECVSTDAGYRGGATRSSEEGPVTGLERRGCPIRPEPCAQPARGGRA